MTANPGSHTPSFAGCEGTMLASRYRLDSFIAQGSFGGVFRASHLCYGSLLRTVAVKISRRPMSDSEARHAFGDALLMTRVADAVVDPILRSQFVAVYDAGICPVGERFGGHPYLVMELVPGTSLAGCLRKGPFPLARAAPCFEQLVAAMAVMHRPVDRPDGRRGPIVHRDLKPENILMTLAADGTERVKLTDFGCARELDHVLAAVESGGDLSYLAPESFASDTNSTRSDIYMLGLVAYEMLTGRNPFKSVGIHLRGDSPENRMELRRLHLQARQQESFAGLDSVPELNSRPRLKELIRQMLHNDPNRRPVSETDALLTSWRTILESRSATPARPHLTDEEAVAESLNAAEQCFRSGNDARGEELLADAQAINRDSGRIPDHMVNGRAYLLDVRRLVARSLLEEAGAVAQEAYRRRRTKDTCTAMAHYLEHAGATDLSDHFRKEGLTLPS